MENGKSKNEIPVKAKFCKKLAVLSFILVILGPFTIFGIFLPDVMIINLSVLASTILALMAIDFGNC